MSQHCRNGGGGGGGGGSGDGAGDGDGQGAASGSGAGDDAGGDGREAPDPAKHPLCGTKSHPVDVVTGRAFTPPIVDFVLAGPLPLVFRRSSSSKIHARDFGLGPSWAHTLGWEIEIRRDALWVFSERGTKIAFPLLQPGEQKLGPFGWQLRLDARGYELDADDGVFRRFDLVTEVRGRLTQVRDRNGNAIELAYDARGVLAQVIDSAGRMIRAKCDGFGHVLEWVAEDGAGSSVKLAEYGYDELGRLVRAADAEGHAHRYAYSDRNQLTLDRDRSGLQFHFVFDEKGRCVESWGDYGERPDPSLAEGLPRFLHDGKTRCKGVHHCLFEWGHNGYSLVTDSTQSASFFGNKFGLIDKAVEGSAVTTAQYDENGHMVAITNGEGGRIEYQRDDRGRIVKWSDGLRRPTTIDRAANGPHVRVVDPSGAETIYGRGSRGNLTSVCDAIGGVTRYEVDHRGLVVTAVDERGAPTRASYDVHGNRVSVTEPDGSVWAYGYDGFGRRTSMTDPLGHVTGWVYSPRGDLLELHDALGGVTAYQYDGEGHLMSEVSPAGNATRYLWGGYNRLVSRTNANGHAVRLGYSVEGEVTHVWNPKGEVHRYDYSPSGLVTGERTFDGRQFHYRHDKAGRLVLSHNENGEAVKFEYDAAGQLVSRATEAGGANTYQYDLRGDLCGSKSSSGVESIFERDALGNILRDRQILHGEPHEVALELDASGNHISRRTSLGYVEEVARDNMGRRRATIVDGRRIEHANDARGREIQRQLPGGGLLRSAYDSVGRLVERQSVKPTAAISVDGQPQWMGAQNRGVTAHKSFHYNADDELIAASDQKLGRIEYRYDPLGQLLAMIPEKARTELFRYDANGNIHEDGEELRREYEQGNRLVRRGTASYKWDAAGQLVEKRVAQVAGQRDVVWRYGWSQAGLMSKAESSEGLLVEFVYDAFSRRIEKRAFKRAPGQKPVLQYRVRFVWDADVLVHEIRTSAGSDPVVEERTYCFEDGSFIPMAQRDVRKHQRERAEGPWFHYLNDPVGTPERLVDSEGSVVCELTRTAWGKFNTNAGATTSTPLRFQGQYEDAETGLAYNRFRYYDAEMGRFISADPIELTGGLNVFKAPRNQQTWIDPFGLAPRPEPGRAGKKIADEGGVTIQSHGTNDEDRPAHAHVSSEGQRDCRIGPNGKPLAGQRPLTAREKAVVERNLKAIRKELKKVGRAASRMEAEGTLPGAMTTSKTDKD